MSFEIRLDLTTEAPWANSWCGFRATVAFSGAETSEPFELQYVFQGPAGEMARGGMGTYELGNGQQLTTDEFNVQPLEAGSHTLTVAVWQNGNEQAAQAHDFTVQ
jgi:hypothetical protein